MPLTVFEPMLLVILNEANAPDCVWTHAVVILNEANAPDWVWTHAASDPKRG